MVNEEVFDEEDFDDFEEEIKFDDEMNDEIGDESKQVNDESEDEEPENNEEKDIEQKTKKKTRRRKNETQIELEELYEQYNELRTEASQKRKEAGEYRKEMVHILEQNGIDTTVINGPDGLVEIGIEIKEEEVVDKRNLAKAIGEGVKARDLSNPQSMMMFFENKLITKELIEEYTKTNEQELFIDRTYKPNEE